MTTTPKTALITGASRGLGRAIAHRLATNGTTIAVGYGHNETAAHHTVATINNAGGNAYPIHAPLDTPHDITNLITTLEHHLDGQGLDILINNAAAAPTGPIHTDTPEQFDKLFAINVKAPYFLTQQALPLLNDGGRIITLTSAVTRIANPGQTSFAMTKAALETMTRTLASALGTRGITVNAVAPGVTRTETNTPYFDELGQAAQDLIINITALNRLGQAEDIADAVAFLASDDARWITGNILDASGGLHLGLRT